MSDLKYAPKLSVKNRSERSLFEAGIEPTKVEKIFIHQEEGSEFVDPKRFTDLDLRSLARFSAEEKIRRSKDTF